MVGRSNVDPIKDRDSKKNLDEGGGKLHDAGRKNKAGMTLKLHDTG
jgi:hypothetical protein